MTDCGLCFVGISNVDIPNICVTANIQKTKSNTDTVRCMQEICHVCYSESERREEAKKRLEKRLEKREKFVM